MSRRPATPPIINNPLDDDDDEQHNFNWYYAENAGGYVLPFGKHVGQKIHETSISYLYWCQRTLDRNRYGSTICAFQAFLDGLQGYLATNCGDFRIPFGMYKGNKISECPDSYLAWANAQPKLVNKYGIFFKAVTKWLESANQQPEDEETQPEDEETQSEDEETLAVSTQATDGRNEVRAEQPTESSLPKNRSTHILRISCKIAASVDGLSDAGPQGRNRGREQDGETAHTEQPTTIFEPEVNQHKAPGRLKQNTVSTTVKLQEQYVEAQEDPTSPARRSARVMNLRVVSSEKSRSPSSASQKNDWKGGESEQVTQDPKRGNQQRRRDPKGNENPLRRLFHRKASTKD